MPGWFMAGEGIPGRRGRIVGEGKYLISRWLPQKNRSTTGDVTK
jgi:hypothetical protein